MDTKWNCDLALRVIALRALSPDSWTYMYGTIIRDSLGVVGEGEGELPRACIIFIR